MRELTLLIADDHELIRRGLRDLLATQSDWRVVGEACNGAEAVEMAEHLRPDIVILDFFMPKLNGSAAAAQIISRAPETGVLILTMDDSEQVVREVLQSGASGLVLKSEADRDLLGAIKSIAENRQIFAGHVARVMLSRYLSGAEVGPVRVRSRVADLTNREVEILRLLAEGLSSKRVATQLQISVRTVESHRTNISRKLSLGGIADLVRYAVRAGIVAHS
jgi:DNA-binding NarL/FixJ family response regulator